MFRTALKYKPSRYTIKYSLFVMASLIPINIILWYISNANDLGRSYINLDYLIPILLASLLYWIGFARIIFIATYLFVYIVDIGKLIADKFGFEGNVLNTAGTFGDFKTFNIISTLYWGDLLSELKQMSSLSYNIFTYGLMASAILALIILIKNKSKVVKFLFSISAIYLLLTLIFQPDSVFMLSLEIFVFLFLFFILIYKNIKAYTSRSDLLVFSLVVYYFMFLGVKSHEAQEDVRNFFSNFTTFVVFNFEAKEKNIDSASKGLFEDIKNNNVSKYDNIILVIVESLGKLKDESSMKAIMKTFDDSELKKNYDVDINYLNYKGHTTTAEFRELCRWQIIGLPNITNKGEFDSCLPVVLKNKGFATTAIHNSSKYVFDRNQWWPLLNFDNIHFLQDMSVKYNYTNFCNGGKGYTSICEKDIMGSIIPDLMNGHKKNFIYFLTVESHTPIDEDVPVTPEYKKICDENPIMRDKKSICKIYDIQNNLFLGTIGLAKKLASKNNLIIIVGDHTPPLFKISLNEAFDKKVIPMIIIKSRKN